MIEFSPFRYDPEARLLYRGDEEIPLPMRVVAVLESFLKRPGQIVQKDDILASAWEGAFVGEDSLTQAVSQLRSALGDDPHRPSYIQTIPKRGYRLIAEVSEPLTRAEPVPQPTANGDDAEIAATGSPAATPEQLDGNAGPPPTFSAGATVGRYELVARIGAGAMGQVWRARDTELQRDVAIKVVPDGLAGEVAVIERFRREALMLAAVNHPNIATIHGVEETDGTRFIVMELLEGETLQERLERGALSVEQALEIALRITRALKVAHDAGIVHRDLKPGNVMVAPDGQVKVLDFGLAKNVLSDDGTVSTDPTALTGTGLPIGTAAYMSPEQAAGRPIDKRSDVFSFGCVVFEMLAGQRPFGGATPSEIVAAILRDEPDWDLLPESLPTGVRRLLRRCLQKDPDRRLHDAADARIEIEEALATHSAPTQAGTTVTARLPGSFSWLTAFAGVVALIGIAAVATMFLGSPEDEIPVGPPEIRPVTFDGGEKRAPTLSPATCDMVAFDWAPPDEDNTDIYVRELGSGKRAIRVTDDPAWDIAPTWSPDGTELAFVRVAEDRASIHITPRFGGGQERKLVDVEGPFKPPDYPDLVSVDWSPDGRLLAYSQRPSLTEPSRIMLLDLDTRQSRPLSTPEAPGPGLSRPVGDLEPSFSPDGQRIAFARTVGPYGGCDIWIQDVEDGTPARRLTFESWGACNTITWAPAGGELLFTAGVWGNLRTYRMSTEEGGAPTLAEWLGPNEVAADVCGRRVVFERHDIDPRDIWQAPGRLADDPGAPERPLIESTAQDAMPAFSPGGGRIAWDTTRPGHWQVWIAGRDGTNARPLTEERSVTRWPSWSPDGEWILFASPDSGDGNYDLWAVNLATDRAVRITMHEAEDWIGSFSPDGNWIYFDTLRAGESEIYRVPFPGGELEHEAERVTHAGGAIPRLSADGRFLYAYRRPSVFRLSLDGPLDSSREEVVVNGLFNLLAWDVAATGIYYQAPADDSVSVMYTDFATDETIEVFRTPDLFHGLVVSPDEKALLFSRPFLQPRHVELALIDNFR